MHECTVISPQDNIDGKTYTFAEMIEHMGPNTIGKTNCTIQTGRKLTCPKCEEAKQMTKDELIEHLETECEQMEMICTTCYLLPVVRNKLKTVKRIHIQK